MKKEELLELEALDGPRLAEIAHEKVKGKTYLADLRWTPDEGNECMILRFTKGGRSYYSRRGIPLTLHSLLKCIDEFAKDGGPKDEGRPL